MISKDVIFYEGGEYGHQKLYISDESNYASSSNVQPNVQNKKQIPSIPSPQKISSTSYSSNPSSPSMSNDDSLSSVKKKTKEFFQAIHLLKCWMQISNKTYKKSITRD